MGASNWTRGLELGKKLWDASNSTRNFRMPLIRREMAMGSYTRGLQRRSVSVLDHVRNRPVSGGSCIQPPVLGLELGEKLSDASNSTRNFRMPRTRREMTMGSYTRGLQKKLASVLEHVRNRLVSGGPSIQLPVLGLELDEKLSHASNLTRNGHG